MSATTPILSIADNPGLSARIAWLEGPRQLRWRNEALPEQPPPGQLRCRTLVSAISPGTELAAYVGLPPLRDGTGYPRLQGYCNVARVEACGAGVEGFAVGDRVLSFASHRSAHLLSASDVLVRLDPDMDAGEIACTYLFHLGYEAVLRSQVRPGSRVLVIGMGALGLSSVALASRAGASVIALTDHVRPAALARDFGATDVLGRADCAQLERLLADVVIVTTNGWDDWTLALRAAAPRATLAVLGFPGRGQPQPAGNPLDSRWFYAKQLRIEAVGLAAELPDSRGLLRFNERSNLAWLTKQIAAGRLPARALISGRFPAAQLAEAYEALLARQASPITYLLDWT